MKKCHIKTIDARHNKFIKEIKNEYNNKNNLEDNLKELNNKLQKYNNIKKTQMTDDDFENYLNIKSKVKDNKNKI